MTTQEIKDFIREKRLQLGMAKTEYSIKAGLGRGAMQFWEDPKRDIHPSLDGIQGALGVAGYTLLVAPKLEEGFWKEGQRAAAVEAMLKYHQTRAQIAKDTPEGRMHQTFAQIAEALLLAEGQEETA